MAWNVGIEEIHIDGRIIEGQWEVDESSEVDAMNTDKIPYLLVGCDQLAYPDEQVVEWVTSNQLAEYNTGYFVSAVEPYVAHLTDEQVQELAGIMDTLSDGVTIADFT